MKHDYSMGCRLADGTDTIALVPAMLPIERLIPKVERDFGVRVRWAMPVPSCEIEKEEKVQ